MRRIMAARAVWILAFFLIAPDPPAARGQEVPEDAVELEVVLSGSGPVTAARFAGRLPRSGATFNGVLRGSGRTLQVYGHLIGDTYSITGVLPQLAGGV